MDYKTEEMDAKNMRRFGKKRRSFLSRERSQMKRGKFGRGADIGEETFGYFLRTLEVKIGDFSTPEDKEIFIDNVFEQTAGREVHISCNQLGSRAMETFLPWANDKILLRFTYAFSKDLRKICTDEFGSHVLQQLIVVVSVQLQKTQIDSNEESVKESQSTAPDMAMRFKNWLQQVCKYVVNNLEEFVWDKFANHIIRTVLECLSGLPPGSTSKEKKWESKEQVAAPQIKSSPIEEGFSLIQECGCRILELPQMTDFVYSNLTSGLLQTVLVTVRKVDYKLTRKIIRHLLDCCFDPESQDLAEDKNKKNKAAEIYIPEIFMSQAATRLMDVMLNVAKSKTFTQIYARCFINKLKPLSLAPDANFCVQSLIRHCSEKSEFEAMFDELSSNFEALLSHKKHGVILILGQTCQRLGCKQGQFVKTLQAALHCVEPERQGLFPLLVALLVNYETWCENMETENNSSKLPVTLTGSLLLQTMLNLPETIKIIKALLDMDCKHLKDLLCNPYGSRVGDAFFVSKTIGEKSREKFFQKLRGSYVALAVSKHGSWILEKVWSWASLKNKKLILEEMAPHEAMLNGMPNGNFFVDKSGLSLFKRRPKDWEACQTREARSQKLFADIIGT